MQMVSPAGSLRALPLADLGRRLIRSNSSAVATSETPDNNDVPIIGLIPAGGHAGRLAPLPCSKEILPVGFFEHPEKGKRPRPVAHYLMESMRQAGVENAYFVLAPGKWDIPAYFGNGAAFGLNLGYLVRHLPFGVPYTIDSAFPFIKDCRVAFGFPDIIFAPADAVVHLIKRQESTEADVVLGVFPVDKPERWDAVEFDIHKIIRRIHPKPHGETTGFTWILAVWTPAFTRFLHEFVENAGDTAHGDDAVEAVDVSLGRVLQAAHVGGLPVDYVVFDRGSCLDIGTPGDLEEALTRVLNK